MTEGLHEQCCENEDSKTDTYLSFKSESSFALNNCYTVRHNRGVNEMTINFEEREVCFVWYAFIWRSVSVNLSNFTSNL